MSMKLDPMVVIRRKCVILKVTTIHHIVSSTTIYSTTHLIALIDCTFASYRFAR